MLCFGNRPFWRASGSMIVRILFTIRSLAYLADRLCRAGRRAARAVPGLGMAAVALTNTGMGFTVAVLRPFAPVVPQHIAGEKCRLICCTNGAETADFTGLVIFRPLRAGRGGFQVGFLFSFCCEAVPCALYLGMAAVVFLPVFSAVRLPAAQRAGVVGGIKAAVLLAAYKADSFPLAGRRAAIVRSTLPLGMAAGIFFPVFDIVRLPVAQRAAVVGGIKTAVLFPTGRADGLFVTSSRAARAIPCLGMVAVALADTGMGFAVTVLRPLAPIVVKSGILCSKRIGVVGAYFTTRTGQIIHCVMGAQSAGVFSASGFCICCVYACTWIGVQCA